MLWFSSEGRRGNDETSPHGGTQPPSDGIGQFSPTVY